MNLYDILGVTLNCSSDEVRHQYNRLLLEHHPDKTTNSTSKIRLEEIRHAYRILSNVELRQKYDQEQERHRLHSLAHTNIDLNDFDDELVCRCGTILTIDKDIQSNIVECPNCSTKIEFQHK